jgi:hypothetical protein
VNDLEKRKEQLAAEAEVYRELLKLEMQNLKILGLNARQRFTSFTPANPLVAAGLPLIASLFGKRKSTWKRLGPLAMFVWQWYRRFSAKPRDSFTRAKAEDAMAAAEEYLSKRP